MKNKPPVIGQVFILGLLHMELAPSAKHSQVHELLGITHLGLPLVPLHKSGVPVPSERFFVRFYTHGSEPSGIPRTAFHLVSTIWGQEKVLDTGRCREDQLPDGERFKLRGWSAIAGHYDFYCTLKAA